MVEEQGLQLSNFNIAVPTAFYQDEGLNPSGTLAHIQNLEFKRFHSFLVCGSTGEQHSLSLSEKIELLNALQNLQEEPKRQILFGVASIRQKEAVELAKKVAESTSIAGILLAFPPYIRPTQEEAYRYAIAVIEAAGKPTVLYNNPLRTGFDLSVETTIALSEHPLVEGVKEAGEDAKVQVFRERITKPFQYFVGGEADMPRKFACGFNAVSSVRGNIYPAEVYAVLEAYLASDLQKVISEYQKLQQLIAPFMSGSVLVEIKKVLNREGIEMGICRSPLGN